jgi:hypothetical protein
LVRRPDSSKSLPVATRAPSTSRSEPANGVWSLGAPVGSLPVSWKVASRSQYEAVTNRMRSRSRSTTMRVATDCTRPAESRGMTFFHSTGLTS